jgi:hypothetical protein
MLHLIFVELDPLGQLSGILGLFTSGMAWFYGILVLIKAIQLNHKIFYYFFLAIIFTISP